MDHPSHPTSKVSSVYKQTTTKTFRDTVRESAPQTSHALRIFLAVVAFVKLIEALFWLALLLEETHNDSDHSTPFLTFMLATGFIISLTTGFVSLFGPCFQAIFLQTSIVLWSCVANFVWDSILLVLSFVLDYYKHVGNEDNQRETAFNSIVGLVTASILLTIIKKLSREQVEYRTWKNKQFASNSPDYRVTSEPLV